MSAFGKNGEVTLLPKEFSKLSKEQLKTIGPLFNKTKIELEQAINNKREAIRAKSYKKLDLEKLDLEPAEIKNRQGHLHPITQFENQTAEIFKGLGFQQFDAPHIDSDYYNFESLNIPKDHPARDLWDTLYIEDRASAHIDAKEKNYHPGELLLRTHTSNSQVRIMEKYKPPIRMMIIDRCFRYENLDARHEHTFDQFELVYIDKTLSMANLQYLSEYFLKAIFGKDMKARLRPKYYPFTEPSAGIDGLCIFCKGKGCKVCGGMGWLELAGAGMIHPQVLKNGGIDPNIYSGIAWGVGPGRMSMIKFGIEDVRLFNSGDLKFLERF
ncbi:phenylalanine--tRNA ligase subunit alpha [Candidatus Daviesbacteria bacterium]|nr:phenylalanine--tRNA ligase subunit alpha [Candidatus Daviesbacteria bacterium]